MDAFSQLIGAARTHFLDVDADGGDDVPVVTFYEEEDDGYSF